MDSKGLYLVLDDLREVFKNEGFNSIRFGDPSEVDLNKQNIYPYMHISLLSRTQGLNTEEITLQLVWLDSVYDGKPLDMRTVPNLFSNVDNLEDVLQDLGQRINRGFLKYLKELDLKNITTNDTLTLTAFNAKAQNKLAGYVATINLTVIGASIC